ncbi:MAG: hypothetical protein WEB59_08950 [Thermoanaerobaculia bacterium]
MFLGTGCATGSLAVSNTLFTDEAKAVRVTQNPVAIKDCTYVGDVNETNDWGEAYTDKKIRVAVVALGGNTVFMSSPMGWNYHGEAYACPAVPATVAK